MKLLIKLKIIFKMYLQREKDISAKNEKNIDQLQKNLNSIEEGIHKL